METDPDGKQLLDVEDKLDAATKYIKLLQKYNLQDVEALSLAAQVYIRKSNDIYMYTCVNIHSLCREVSVGTESTVECTGTLYCS